MIPRWMVTPPVFIWAYLGTDIIFISMLLRVSCLRESACGAGGRAQRVRTTFCLRLSTWFILWHSLASVIFSCWRLSFQLFRWHLFLQVHPADHTTAKWRGRVEFGCCSGRCRVFHDALQHVESLWVFQVFSHRSDWGDVKPSDQYCGFEGDESSNRQNPCKRVKSK